MEGARGGAAIPNAGGADGVAERASQTAGKECARDHGQKTAQVTDHGQQALFGSAAVDVAITPTHGARDCPEVGPHTVENVFAIGDAASLVADQRAINVLTLLKLNAQRGTEGLLALPKINAANDAAAGSIKGAELLF